MLRDEPKGRRHPSMKVGVPYEIKDDEYRVALRPVGAELLVRDGHRVIIERGAGRGSGFADEEYERAGAHIVDGPAALFEEAELIVKVKEPQSSELEKLRPDHVVFGYFHFAASRELTERSLQVGYTSIAYETLADASGKLPLLTPMSEVAGRMSIQEGAKHLEKPMRGRGILLGGVPGVEPANLVVLGGGVVGANAARMAAGLGANVTLMDTNLDRLRELAEIMPANVTTIYSDPHSIDAYVVQADLVIGAVLVRGRRAPRLVTADLVKRMKAGAVIVDVSIDQGGCIETSRPTTHRDPIYLVDDVVHYCVGNMPGAVGRTSTQALCNATLPYVRQLARLGAEKFLALDAGRAASLNTRGGKIISPDVADAFPDLPTAS
jgi:alanine dehydrogenase